MTRASRLVSVLWLVGCTAPVALAQPNPPYDGEVTGNNVYVRSFNDTNSYPTAQLNRGDRVRVVGERSGWLQIEPPSGSFCWIATDKVDRTPAAATATVNADDVYVRIGSTLERWSRDRSMIATQLDRGAQVRIVGESADGFLRIEPPAGAYLWIYGEYVRPVSEAAPAAETPQAPSQVEPGEPAAEIPTEEKPPPPSREFTFKLRQIESELDEELAKPLLEQRLDMFIERLEPVSAQDEERVARALALNFLEYLRSQREAQKILERSKQIVREAAAESERHQERRMAIALAQRERGPFTVRGELRKSWLADVPNQPIKYRLVDPFKERTVAYLLFEPDSALHPERHLGKFLGVYGRRVSDRPEWLVEVFTAEELVELSVPLSPAEVSEPIMTPKPAADSEKTPPVEPSEPGESAEAEPRE